MPTSDESDLEQHSQRPRKSPCASCPYRRNVPSGIWHETEYAKLELYDGVIFEQTTANVFLCHQGEDAVCAGWLGHRTEPAELLAVRVGIIDGRLDPSCAEYVTDVELFGSGVEAAAHGRAEIEQPTDRACETIAKIVRVRGNTLQLD